MRTGQASLVEDLKMGASLDIDGGVVDVEVSYLDGAGSMHRQAISSAHSVDLVTSSPVRTFRMYKGQRHYSGHYWSATMRAFVTYESRLELGRLLLADFDPDVVSILSQPFYLSATIDGLRRVHVPDFLCVTRTRRTLLIDVKTVDALALPSVTETLSWSRLAVQGRGWDYEVWTGAPDLLLANVCFLSGFRNVKRSYTELLDDARDAAHPGMTFEEAVSAMGARGIHEALARPALLHLLWSGWLTVDLSEPIDGDSLLGPAP